jgi:tetratricopeptide (TPR) repeat protein
LKVTLWQESYKIHPYGYAVHYDLGLCAEYHRGDFHEALKYYEMADKLSPKPVKVISEALGRANTGLNNQANLDQQLGRKRQFENAKEETNSIADVQRWLNKLGYDAGMPDGLLGHRTKAAIRAYQNDYGLPVDGEITGGLLRSLRQKSQGRM